ncbi:MAG: serine/threonine protein kinase [Gemmatimonadota bacterium]|nr:serine/threonine protein kinase [Gemmatimonadota bacterium]
MTSITPDLSRHARALAPDFQLEREIGRGGMGVVYLALDVRLDRHVAVKVLPDMLTESATIRDRFLREARTAARLSHPNIVPIYRADEKDGVVFFVMRYVDGESLAERIARRGTLPATEAASLLREVALALDYANGRSVVHRDIKPENIVIERGSEEPMVTDFGIARVMEAAPATATGQVLGTVHYMSPEQVLGEQLDGRSDLYSLGVVGFRALTGALPFNADTATAVLVSHVTKAAPKVLDVAPGVPPALAAIIDRCLMKDRDARFASGAEMAKAIDEAAGEIARHTAEIAQTPPVVSAREAEAVWKRAAELQAETGLQQSLRSPAQPLAPSTDEDRRSLTSGYKFENVRDAAAEAGIPQRYVDRAASDLGLATATNAGSSLGFTVETPKQNIWAGSPMSIFYEVEVPFEASPEDYELFVDMIRRKVGEPSNVSTLGRTLLWSVGDQQRKLQLTIATRAGRTTIRADERLKPLAGALFGGIVGGVGGGVGSVLGVPLGAGALHSVFAGLGMFAAVVASALLFARRRFRVVRSKREADLRSVVDAIADQIRRSAQPTLPRGRT